MAAVGKAATEAIFLAGRDMTFHAADNLRSVEVFFTFEKNDHGRGPFSRILRHLACIGPEKAAAQFGSKRFPKNKAMLTAIARCGLPLKKSLKTASCRCPCYFLLGCSELDLDEAFLGAVARVSIRREFIAFAFVRSEAGLNSVRNFRRIFPLWRVGLLKRK